MELMGLESVRKEAEAVEVEVGGGLVGSGVEGGGSVRAVSGSEEKEAGEGEGKIYPAFTWFTT